MARDINLNRYKSKAKDANNIDKERKKWKGSSKAQSVTNDATAKESNMKNGYKNNIPR